MAIIRHVGKLEDHYTMIPNDFSRDKRVTPRAARVYLFLASHRDECRMTTRSMAEGLDMGKETVSKAVRELETLGWVIRSQQTDGSGRFSGITYEVSRISKEE